MTRMNDLSDCHIVITGGLGDIGIAMAEEMLGRGARLALLDIRSHDEIKETVGRLRERGEVKYICADVRSYDAVATALAALSPFDVAIGNAALGSTSPFLEITPEHWQDHLDVDLTGCFNLGHAAATMMVSRGIRGRVIFTSSWVQEVPWPDIAAYAVSKAGLRQLARCMARELAAHGILVNVIAPGIVEAGMAGREIAQNPVYAHRIQHVVPLGRLQTPADVAGAAAFLCTEAASYMTGSTLLVDGGCSLFKFEP